MSASSPKCPEGRGLLEGKVVVVTAAAGAGIGSATARRCVEEGATMVISDIHERRLEEEVDALSIMSETRPLSVLCDVTVEKQVQNLFNVAVAEYGRVDVLVNNAGLGAESPLVEMDDEEWQRVMDVTLTGTMRCTRTALRHMIPRGVGAIVNVASVLGWRAQVGQTHYAAAKAGVMAMTRCAALEAAEAGVRVNCVAPSLVVHPYLARTSSEDLIEGLVEREAFGRSAEPWEVANVVVFLASDYSSYMTGEVVSVSNQRA